MLQWERRHPWRRLTTSHSKNSGGPIVSPSLSSSSPHGERARERTGLPSNAMGQDIETPSFEYTHCTKEGAKNGAPSGQDVEPPSFEYTQRSKEGAKNDAPPNEQRPLGRRLGKASRSGVFHAPTGTGAFPGARRRLLQPPTTR